MESNQPGGAAGPQGGRGHHFKVKFSHKDIKYTVDCDQPCTVLEGIQTKQKYKQLNYPEKNLIIQLGKGDDYIVATHFPSSCVPRGDTAVHSRDRYSVLYTPTVRRTNSKTNKIFIHKAVKLFKYLHVYRDKRTLKEALQRDGRFRDDLCNFTLSTKILFSIHYFLKVRSTLNVMFKKHDTYSISCDRPCTVLEALKSSQIYNELKWSHENLEIQMGAECGEVIIATNFTCSCINCGLFLEISHESEEAEVQDKSSTNTAIYLGDKYSVFYIDTVRRKTTKTKRLFKNNAVKYFKYMCVCGEIWMTVEEALKRDGRFSDDLYNFTLCCQKIRLECAQKFVKLHRNKFKICLPRNKTANDKRPVLYIACHREFGVRAAVEISDNTEKILLHQSRFSNNSYQRALGPRRENFEKIQQPNLRRLGRSVCKVIVDDDTGTGFVLFDNFILTNAHLFKDCVEAETLKKGVEVFVLFNYDDPEPDTDYCCFEVIYSYIYFKVDDLDYAVLQLNTEGQRVSNHLIPPGLLKDVGPMPESGDVCLIGHPGGKCKQFDLTRIIEKEKRGQAVDDKLHPYKDSLLTLHSISHLIREQGIENIMIGGKLAEKRSTYKTFMYHGSSGSPVFDAQCKVFGLHTGGFVYGFPNTRIESVIEYAQPLCAILKHFVNMLKTKGLEELLNRFKGAAKGNSVIQKVIESTDFENCSDSSEPMDTD